MKQLLLLCLLGILLSCNTETKPPEVKPDSVAKKVTYTYPVTPKYSLNWVPGDEKYAVTALTSFKKWIDGDVKGALADFADSIEFIGDKFHFTGTRDSLEKMFTAQRAIYTTMSLTPDTWLTSYYPDRDDTWVTVWATEYWTDKKGKMDSLYVVDDILLKNGKIKMIDEKQRMFPTPMAKK